MFGIGLKQLLVLLARWINLATWPVLRKYFTWACMSHQIFYFLSINTCGYLPWTPTAKPTHPSNQIYHAHLDWRPTLCWWPSPHFNMSARTAIYASCLPTLEYPKSHANWKNGLLQNPCPPPRPGGSTPAWPNNAPLPHVLTLSNLRPPLVSYPRSLPIWVP